jgi:hypothetical protein
MGRLWVRAWLTNRPQRLLLEVAEGFTPTSILKAHTGATVGALVLRKQEGKGAESLAHYPLTPLEVKSTIYLPFGRISLQGFALQS